MAIGAEVGVRKLVQVLFAFLCDCRPFSISCWFGVLHCVRQDLAGAGDRQNVAEDERAVFRALQVMESSGEIAYVHQRKLVKRLK